MIKILISRTMPYTHTHNLGIEIHTHHVYMLFIYLFIIKCDSNLKKKKKTSTILNFLGGSETNNKPEWSLLNYFHKGEGNYACKNLHCLVDGMMAKIKVNKKIFSYKFKNDRPLILIYRIHFKAITFYKEVDFFVVVKNKLHKGLYSWKSVFNIGVQFWK